MRRSWIWMLPALLTLAACTQQQAPQPTEEPASVTSQDASDLFFSEYTEGSSNNKALEIYNGTSGAIDLSDYRVEMYFNGSDDPGLTIDLSGTVADGDVFVLAHASADSAILDEADQTDGAGFYNGDDAVVLKSNDDVVDAIGQVGTDPGSEWGSGTTSTANNTLRRKASINAGDTDPDDAFDPSVEWNGFAQDTFDGLGTVGDEGGGDEGSSAVGTCGEPATLVHAIQGDGPASPLDGDTVIVEGVVVGDFQGGDALEGFYLQEEDADQDGDPATSEGLFVFEGAAPVQDVAEGDVVRVAGTVDEYQGLTELTDVTDVVACETTGSVTPTDLTLPLTPEERERAENMLVAFPQELVISEYFNYDRFGEIVLSLPPDGLDRPFQPTSYAEPGSDQASDIAEAIPQRRITLDDGRSDQNPDPLRHPNGEEFTLDNRFRGGDVVRDATGVLDYGFGLYRIQPTTGATHVEENPRPAAPDDVGGDLQVATLNVLNYFTTIDDGDYTCGPALDQECRGADTAEEFERQEAKIVAALAALDADVVGLIEIQNNDGVVQTLVDALNDQVGAGTYAAIETGAIGPDAIRQAFIYQPDAVTPAGEPAVLDSDAFLDPNDLGEAKNRPALAQTFEQNSDGARFTAVVNHLKSKGSGCGPGDDDPEQGNCNLTRTLAAQELLDWLDTDPTNSGDPDYLILGDLNAYDEEDPITTLKNGGYTDLAERDEGEFTYTYVFDGLFGHLDYALANASLEHQVTGATNWPINADEPDVLDYDTTFKQPPQQDLYQENPYRSSDHDPVLVGLDLNLNQAPECSAAQRSPDTLWPANHEMIPIDLDVTDPDGDTVTLEITRIQQDEPVDADAGDGHTAPDGQGIGSDTAKLRAERLGGGNGRTYHITFTATDEHDARCTGTTTVSVPTNQGRNGSAVDDGAPYDSTQRP